jgi:hypothetical protein
MADDGILSAIGDTPLVRLHRIVPGSGAEIWVKLEYRNPTGSMKDRMGLSMIEGAERDGLIEPGTTIVEYTGGSTGPALALVCRAKGYRAHRDLGVLQRGTNAADACARRGARADSRRRGTRPRHRPGHPQHGRPRR